jgi:hypothetical protein
MPCQQRWTRQKPKEMHHRQQSTGQKPKEMHHRQQSTGQKPKEMPFRQRSTRQMHLILAKTGILYLFHVPKW